VVPQVPHVLPGGGCAEVLLASYLRLRTRLAAKRLTALQARALATFADALEDQAVALVAPHLPDIDPRAALRVAAGVGRSHDETGLKHVYIGWSHEHQALAEVAAADAQGRVAHAELLDLVAPRLAALASAVEVACTVLRIECVIGSDAGQAHS
jgi:chaperonin GroEL (HSP60 family)